MQHVLVCCFPFPFLAVANSALKPRLHVGDAELTRAWTNPGFSALALTLPGPLKRDSCYSLLSRMGNPLRLPNLRPQNLC